MRKQDSDIKRDKSKRVMLHIEFVGSKVNRNTECDFERVLEFEVKTHNISGGYQIDAQGIAMIVEGKVENIRKLIKFLKDNCLIEKVTVTYTRDISYKRMLSWNKFKSRNDHENTNYSTMVMRMQEKLLNIAWNYCKSILQRLRNVLKASWVSRNFAEKLLAANGDLRIFDPVINVATAEAVYHKLNHQVLKKKIPEIYIKAIHSTESVGIYVAAKEIPTPDKIEDWMFEKVREVALYREVVIELTCFEMKNKLNDIWRSVLMLNRLGFDLVIIADGNLEDCYLLISYIQPKYIKLPKKLTERVHLESRKRQSVLGYIALADKLGIKPIASGVDNFSDYIWLQKNGIHLFQGKIFEDNNEKQGFWTRIPEYPVLRSIA